jgi:23S rRNA (uracil1939-C5)-methyltransferase
MPEQTTFDIDLINLVYGGDALGRLPDGRAVFVPFGLPGEQVRVRLTEQKRGFVRAELLEVLRPSPDRIEPACKNYAACGGCHYMHMTYAAQLTNKTAIVRDQLQRIAGIENPPVASIVASPLEWHYRNSVQFHLNWEGKLGFQQPNSHTVVPVEACPLCAPAIEEIVPLMEFSDENGQAARGLQRIQVRAGVDDDLMLVLESGDPVPPEITIDLPVNAVFVGPGGFEENEPLVLSGDNYLMMAAAGREYRVSAGSFFQVNIGQAEAMLRYLEEHLPLNAKTTLLEVYAGVGLFSAHLAPKVARLIAIEAAPSAIDDFAANLDEFDHVELYDGPAEEILPNLDLKPDVVVVDPPRSGLALPALDALVKMKAPFLAYVSCDPATLARDLKRLVAAGYRVEQVQPFDMFPQTYHVENIVLLTNEG